MSKQKQKKYTFQYSVFADCEEDARKALPEMFTTVEDWIDNGAFLEEEMTKQERQMQEK